MNEHIITQNRLLRGLQQSIFILDYELAILSGVTPSTVYSMMDDRRKDVSVITVKKLCDGLDITIPQFFDDPLFERLEQEIQ